MRRSEHRASHSVIFLAALATGSPTNTAVPSAEVWRDSHRCRDQDAPGRRRSEPRGPERFPKIPQDRSKPTSDQVRATRRVCDIFAGAGCFYGIRLKEMLNANNALQVVGIHGVGGTWGTLEGLSSIGGWAASVTCPFPMGHHRARLYSRNPNPQIADGTIEIGSVHTEKLRRTRLVAARARQRFQHQAFLVLPEQFLH